ncbi:MAG: hypothetical protein IKS69_05900 [Erysipelotrichaceae bacterium]|nr:hypothetical protein [Erysipelotrichaceae bacterium]
MMVNCKKCGAPLSLEQEKCPYCGEINEEAREHLRKLAKLDKDYKKTRQEVITEVKKTKSGYNLLIVLVMLLLANLILIPFWGASYEIAEKIAVSDKDVSEVKAQLKTLLDSKEYPEFVICYDRNNANYREYSEFSYIYYLANEYVQVIEQFTNHLYTNEDYYTDPLVRVCQSLKEFKEDYERYSKRDNTEFEAHYMNEVNSEFELFVKTFMHLKEEDISRLGSLTSSEIVILVNERLNNEE